MTEEISIEFIKKTQKTLGKYVKKPPLTDKLLRKPPFRFLHDVVHTVIKETGYLQDLFSEEELVSDNVKDKDAKVAFLDKLIDAVKSTTKTKLPVRSSKIVAGLEPANTNLLLQAIAKAIDDKVDSSNYINQLKSGGEKEVKKSKDGKSKSSSKTKIVKSDKEAGTKKREKTKEEIPKLKKVGNETPKSKKPPSSRDSSKTKPSPRGKVKEKVPEKKVETPPSAERDPSVPNTENLQKESTELKNTEAPQELNELYSQKVDEEKTQSGLKLEENPVEISTKTEEKIRSNTSLSRPKSARPKSGDKKAKYNQDIHPEALDLTANNVVRPKSSLLRPPSVRPSSARPGAPRLRPDSALPLQEAVPMGNINVIVENFDAAADDEETVVIETAPDELLPSNKEASETPEVSEDNRGQLVEQILEQIKEEEGDKKRVDIDWEAEAYRNRDVAHKDVHQLRANIQNLTKTASPLGKLLNYLHEDIDAMHAELQMWLSTKKQLAAEIRTQKKLSIEANKPLLVQLEQLRQEIGKVKQEILTTQSNILINDNRIKELLSK